MSEHDWSFHSRRAGIPRTPDPEGFDAMGRPIPPERRSAAYRWLKDELGLGTEDAMELIGVVASALERDQPYEAMKLATDAPIPRESLSVVSLPARSDYPKAKLDVTGGYRLFAYLLAG